jgi:hypothetical protein
MRPISEAILSITLSALFIAWFGQLCYWSYRMHG